MKIIMVEGEKIISSDNFVVGIFDNTLNIPNMHFAISQLKQSQLLEFIAQIFKTGNTHFTNEHREYILDMIEMEVDRLIEIAQKSEDDLKVEDDLNEDMQSV